jgi:predicted acetyltransferase
LSIVVAPCTNREEFVAATGAIGHYSESDDMRDYFSVGLPLDRMYAAWDDGRIVGGAGDVPFDLSVPGSTVPTAGVTMVGTYPTHRRRGVLSSLMRAQLDYVHARGECLALLWASEDSIYGRYGYGMASAAMEVAVPKERSAFARTIEPEATLRVVELEEALTLFPRVYDAILRQTPGMIGRTREWWEGRILGELWGGSVGRRLVVLERAGRPEAYAIYRLRRVPEARSWTNELYVQEAVAVDGAPMAELWRYLLDIDLVARVSVRMLPVDHPLWWLLAAPSRMQPRIGSGLWARLVDVGAALSARKYTADGAVVFDVVDDFCPWNTGLWRLADGTAKRTKSSPQLRLDVTALGSAYLGGFKLADLARAGRIEELRRGAAARADAMFASARAPWCPEIF